MSATCNREAFDAWTLANIQKLVEDLAQIARIIEKQYPRTTEQAVAELIQRGFFAEEHLLKRWSDLFGVGVFGTTLAWFKSDIDKMAGFLEATGKLTAASRRRIADGRNWEDDNA